MRKVAINTTLRFARSLLSLEIYMNLYVGILITYRKQTSREKKCFVDSSFYW